MSSRALHHLGFQSAVSRPLPVRLSFGGWEKMEPHQQLLWSRWRERVGLAGGRWGLAPAPLRALRFTLGLHPRCPCLGVCVCRASSLPALSLPKGDTPLHLPPNFPLGTPLGGMAESVSPTGPGILLSPGDYNSQRSIGRGSLVRPGLSQLVTTRLTNGFRSYTRSHTQRPIRGWLEGCFLF